jgi:hypothetical protein
MYIVEKEKTALFVRGLLASISYLYVGVHVRIRVYVCMLSSQYMHA